jgi:DNA-binding FadR family transcriptional regulator
MSISSVSSMTNIYPMYQLDQTSAQNKAGQFRQEFNALASALQSGDLSGAQQAFAALQKLLPSSSAGNQTQTGQQGSGQNTFATDFNALGQALQSNDPQKAQEAFAKLEQDIQSVQGRHHHHHHHRKASDSTQGTTGKQTQTGQQGSGQNTFATDFNALGQALQSNDLQKAQEAFAKLQQDIQSVQGRHHHHHHHDASASTQSIPPTTSNASVASDAGAAGDGSGSGSINVVA